MTQEDKQLLLKDLCARLPYITYYDLSYYGHKTRAVLQEFMPAKESLKSLVKVNTIVEPIPYENIKPYLRPMASMDDEEKKEFDDFCVIDVFVWEGNVEIGYKNQASIMSDGIDWLLEHHFDFRGLIEKGLALEAPENMY